jgi:hypothetical protein
MGVYEINFTLLQFSNAFTPRLVVHLTIPAFRNPNPKAQIGDHCKLKPSSDISSDIHASADCSKKWIKAEPLQCNACFNAFVQFPRTL